MIFTSFYIYLLQNLEKYTAFWQEMVWSGWCSCYVHASHFMELVWWNIWSRCSFAFLFFQKWPPNLGKSTPAVQCPLHWQIASIRHLSQLSCSWKQVSTVADIACLFSPRVFLQDFSTSRRSPSFAQASHRKRIGNSKTVAPWQHVNSRRMRMLSWSFVFRSKCSKLVSIF